MLLKYFTGISTYVGRFSVWFERSSPCASPGIDKIDVRSGASFKGQKLQGFEYGVKLYLYT